MMPMSQLEVICGAILAKERHTNPDNIRIISKFKGFNVIDAVKSNRQTFVEAMA